MRARPTALDVPALASAALVALALVALPGCYLFHGLDGAGVDRPGDPPATRDAATPTPTPRDAAVASPGDAGPALPAEPDPDLGPDARPSDYPDADDWEDPPALDADDPCCELGEPIRITSRDEGMALAHEPPSIAWGPGRWGLLVTRQTAAPTFDYDPRAIVFELASEGTPLGPPRDLERSTERAGVLRWAEGRWAVTVTGDALHGDVREWYARLYDRELRAATDWIAVGAANLRAHDIARLTTGDRWIAAQGLDGDLALTPFSELGADAAIATARASGSRLAAAGLRSRIAILVARHPDEPRANEIVVVGAAPAYATLGGGMLESRYGDDAALAALRDRVVAVGIEDGRAHAEVFDPFEMTRVGAPVALGPARSDDGAERIIAVSGSAKHGVAGVCWAAAGGAGRRDAPGAIDFRLVGPDGAARGAAVRVHEGPFRGGMSNCAVGSDDEGFLVAWWDGSALWVRRVDVAR